MDGTSATLRCAEWARTSALAPAGTAARADVFVLVEHPLPWPSDVGEVPALARLAEVAADAAGAQRLVRIQAVAPDHATDQRRVVVFAAPGGPFGGYGRCEAVGTAAEVPGLVRDLVGGGRCIDVVRGVTDVLVCTHGSRDLCCGSIGTRLWADLEGRLEGVRLWRTSHLGGHRFAPTMTTFPDGCSWAHLDGATARGIVERTLPVGKAAEHFRGCAAFDAPVQVADGEAFARHGWRWLEASRSGVRRPSLRIELTYEADDGRGGAHEVWLDAHRRMPIPDCPGDVALATKFQSELRVVRWREQA